MMRWMLLLCGVIGFALMGAKGGCGPVTECEVSGQTYQVGDTFKKDCNTCTCGESGQIACTEIACITTECGGSTGKTCNKKEYCAHAEAKCGSGTGSCQVKPTNCDTDYSPVCGCDGKTYGNACGAAAAGISINTEGKCKSGVVSCEYSGKKYKDGTSFLASDGCNKCSCASGTVNCTEKSCLPKSCQYDGKEHKDGASFPARDGCNECSCKDGQVICTKKECPVPACQYDGKEYKEGSIFKAVDGCNDCTCLNFQVSCTKKNCPPVGCSYEGKNYKEGDSFPASDGCNKCVCKTGQVACTKIACPKSCEYKGKTYKNGDSFPASDGCNKCVCKDGQIACTKIACPRVCQYNGREYKEGDSFPASDGCNKCVCKTGQAVCTKISCPKSCKYGGKIYKDGATFPALDGCNSCSCQSGQSFCTKRACLSCGTRGAKSCLSTQYCNQPIHCGATDLPGVCVMKPSGCRKLYAPVCGCDNRTYGNACMAALSGVSIRAQGECKVIKPKNCSYDGKIYGSGTSFLATDGCNKCSCTNGQVACTKIACVQKCGRGLKSCPSSEYCNQWGHCGTTFIPGVCSKKPTSCNRIYAPVCGCDGKTYSNSCQAASAGVSVKNKGKC